MKPILNRLKKAALLFGFALLSSCVSTPPKTMGNALLTQPSVATTQVLNASASQALGGTRVLFARNAFTQSSVMKLERMGQNGRLMGVPKFYRFSLKRSGGTCFLVYQKTGQAYPLEGVKCRR